MSCLTRKILLVLFISISATNAHAESDAVVFAWSIGAIAGAAQACGKDIALLVPRVHEALSILAVNEADKLDAITVFQNKISTAYDDQKRFTRRMPCNMVMNDYYSMPILRDDYQTTVLPKLTTTAN